jgi:hypothetical protein
MAEDAQPARPQRFAGYDRGFVIADRDTECLCSDDFPFLMRVNSWMHMRHTLFASDGPNPDQNTLSFERLRLSFGGHAFTPRLRYFLQFDGTSDRSTETRMLDYFVSYDLLGGPADCGQDRFGIRFGKWKVPFSRSREESGRRLQFADRSSANIFFDLNRSIGVGLFGKLASLPVPIHWETAVFNGFKTGMTSTNRRDREMDTSIAWSMRSYTDLWGEYASDGEPDLSCHSVPVLRLGGGTAYSRVDEEGISEYFRQRVVDSGKPLAELLPAGVHAYDIWFCTVDSHWKYGGFSLIAEYYWRYITRFSGGNVPGLFDHGFNLQTGYFVCPETLELHFRWARMVGDSGTLGLANQSSDEVTGGLTWFIRGHNAKLVFDATHLNGVPLSSARLDTLPGDAGWLFQTQVQLAF